MDRNLRLGGVVIHATPNQSLPSRGAWIEMTMVMPVAPAYQVAPLAGSVDRNNVFAEALIAVPRSLPSRGAWIEIPLLR